MIDSVKSPMETLVPQQKKAYQTPELVAYGTVADLTATTNNAGGNFDTAKSGNRSA